MVADTVVMSYVYACTGGSLPLSECGPVWQLGIIATLLFFAVFALVALRILARMKRASPA